MSAPTTTPDKRFSPRLNATASDYVVYVEGSGKVRDVSLGGVFIEDSQPFPVGTVFGFTLSLANEQLSVKGVVRQCVPDKGMGVRFHEITNDARNRLERILNQMVRSHAGKG
ncbi:MAG: PilZ domain-containing protein [Candidatus Acidiferrales bacterium]